MRALIMGATAGVGRALSEALARRGYALLLVASDERDLDAQANHLRLLHDAEVETLAADASQPERCLDLVGAAVAAFGPIDAWLFPIGASREDDRGLLTLPEARRLLEVNLLVVMGLVGMALPGLLARGKGVIVGFGSVAAARGRGANVIYAASKRGLESYFESLRHLAGDSGVAVQYYKLGYVATQQTFGKRLLFSAVSPQRVAQTVARNLDHGGLTRCFPAFWGLITRLVSWLPWPLYKRLRF